MLMLKPLRAHSRALATAVVMFAFWGPSFVAAQGTAQKPNASAPPAAAGASTPATGANTAAAPSAPRSSAPAASGAPSAAAPGTPGAPAASTAAPAGAAAETTPLDLRVKLKTLEDWDNTIDALTNLTAMVYNVNTAQDLGGHDLEYYWQQHILTADTKNQLETLRDKAQKQSVAKDTAGLQKTLDEAAVLLTAERVKAFAISMFMNAQAPVIYHQYQLGPWLARATDADRQGINDRVVATYERLSKELQEVVKVNDPDNLGETVQRFYKLIAEPIAFFNAERARLVKAQADLPSPVTVSSRTRVNDKPCPAPVAPVKGREKPGLSPDFPSSESFYPPGARRNDVQGAVTLRVSISETGCIQRAEVAGTSGVAELDEAALNLAMAGSYVPAAGPGDKPTAGTLMFRVKFEQPGFFDSPPK
jgi:TonB family protein